MTYIDCMKCFYHNDPDGWCSAYWVRKHCEKEGIAFTEADFIEMNYDRPFPWNVLQPDEQVFMVDFSLDDPEDMRQLALQTNLTWIDHHISAIVKMGKYCKIPGIRYDGIAACMLTWAYFHFKWYIPEEERLGDNLGFPIDIDTFKKYL